jgi:hypothetical protein
MKRRAFLSTLSIGVSGCISSASGASPREEKAPTRTELNLSDGRKQNQNSTATENETEIVGGGPETMRYLREIEISSTDPSPSSQTEVSVTGDGQAITTEQTAILTLNIKNTADETRYFGFGASPLLGMNSEESPGWMLLPTDDYERVDEECWYPTQRVIRPKILTRGPLQPDESHSDRVELWSGQRDPCMPIGDFRFQGEYYEYREDSDSKNEEETSHEWGFDITVSEWTCE